MNSGKCSEWFEVEQGLCPGCVLPPLLFYVFFAAVLSVTYKQFNTDNAVSDDIVRIRKRKDTPVAGEESWVMLYMNDFGVFDAFGVWQ